MDLTSEGAARASAQAVQDAIGDPELTIEYRYESRRATTRALALVIVRMHHGTPRDRARRGLPGHGDATQIRGGIGSAAGTAGTPARIRRGEK